MNPIILRASAKLVLPALLSASLAGPFGCSGGTTETGGSAASGDQTSATGMNAVRYDGETAFRGVFLGTGPVAAMLPELRDPALGVAAERMTKEQLAIQLEGAATRMRSETQAAPMAGEIERVASDLRSGKVSPEDVLSARRDFEQTSGDRIIARLKSVDPTFFTRFGDAFQSGDHMKVTHALEEGGRAFLDAASVEGVLPGHVVPEMKCVAVVVVVLLFWFVVAINNDVQGGGLHHDELVDSIANRFNRP